MWPIPAQWIAPQHMMHGSVLVTSVLAASVSASSSALTLAHEARLRVPGHVSSRDDLVLGLGEDGIVSNE